MQNDLRILLTDLATFMAGRNTEAWLVGGATRDLLLGRVPLDLDLAVAGDGLALARAYADTHGAAFVPLDASRATGRVVLPGAPGWIIDLAGLRGPTLADDLRLRDFTLNAMALPLAASTAAITPELLSATLVDPTGGRADLAAHLLRPCGPTSLLDDPLRILRAARLCATLGLRPVPELAPMLRAAAPALSGVATERLRDELLRLLEAPSTAPWLHYLDTCGALTHLIPELEPARHCDQPRVHFLPVLAHSLETVAALDWLLVGLLADEQAISLAPEALPVAVQTHPTLRAELPWRAELAATFAERRAGGIRRTALLKLAALLHDNAKPQTKQSLPDGSVSFYGHQQLGAEIAAQICRRLRLSRNDTAYVSLIVREHMRPGQLRTSAVLTARARARLFRDLGDATPDLLLHELADHLAVRGPQIVPQGWAAHLVWVAALLEAFYTPAATSRRPLLNGHQLMEALGLPPGPQLGVLLRAIAEAQAAGEIETPAAALELAQQILQSPDGSAPM